MNEDIIYGMMDSFVEQYKKVGLENVEGLITMKKYKVLNEKEHDLLMNFNILCIGALEKVAGQNRKIG